MISQEEIIKATGLSKVFKKGQDVRVLDGLDFALRKGEFVAVVGPNGCGKSTLLSILCGLDHEFGGKVHGVKDDHSVMLFQNYRESLFPWLTVRENIAYPLHVKGLPKSAQEKRVDELCGEFNVNLPLDQYPYELSGGQQQLSALLRALIIRPDIIFMDEPFSALDYETTLSFVIRLQEIWRKTGITMVLVSHDVDEAILLAQKIYVMSKKPMRIIKTFENRIAYPRTTHTMADPEFGRLKHGIADEFINQVTVN